MQFKDLKLKKHLLICTRQKEGKPCCGGKESQILVDELKAWLKEKNLKHEIKVTGTQCLSYCEEGITAYLYPAEKYITGLTLKDAEQLKDILVES